MPYPRKTMKKGVKKPYARRRAPLRRVGRVHHSVGDVYTCKFVRELAGVTVTPTTDSVIKFKTEMGNFTQAAALLTAFDRYKIKKVELNVIPRFNVANTDVNQCRGFIFSLIDQWNQQRAISTATAALNNSRAVQHDFTKPFTIAWRPTIENEVRLDVGGTPTETPMWAPALASTQNNIFHYGAEVLFNNPSPIALHWAIIETVHVEFTQKSGL